MPRTVAQFKEYLDAVPRMLAKTYASTVGVQQARMVIANARRIFFTGSGCSVAAAMLGQELLTRYSSRAGIFTPVSLLLDEPCLTEHDAVVLISQSWDRADAVLITETILQSDAALIVVTGRPTHAYSYTPKRSRSGPIAVPIFPAVEDTFSRPSSSITAYLKIAQLLEPFTDRQIACEDWQAAYLAGSTALIRPLYPDTHYVILASGMLLPAAHNVALALRQGAGQIGTMQEIESYAHGQYVPDRARIEKTRYIVLDGPEKSYPHVSYQRILPLLETAPHTYEVWKGHVDPILTNVTHMARSAQQVYEYISRTGWDMNKPPGIEAVRLFHQE